jgi:gamma-glutamyltranspeptidase/glutathione hydrolase
MLSTLALALTLSGVAASERGAIATAHPLASEAGAAMLRAGGNAVDAAVAAAFALGVVENNKSGLGGGGFALVYVARERKVHALDFREVAPLAATRDMFVVEGEPRPKLAQQGALAVAAPGAVKGYAELARRFGTRPLAALVEPAARLAEAGFTLGTKQLEDATVRLECLRADPAAAREFLAPGPGGRPAPRAPGERHVRKDLARTLRLVGRDPEAFYRGPLARRIVAAVRARGGLLSEEDLARYRVREREPLRGRYRGREVVSMGLPSNGGAIVIGLLQALEQLGPPGGWHGDAWLHRFAEVERRLFARRGALLGDPDFVPAARAAEAEIVSPAFARAAAAELGERATPSSALGAAPVPGRGSENTTHVSVIDREGNAVSMTTTVNGYYGSCLVVPGTGILLNDEMDDFEVAPGVPNQVGLVGRGANAVAPGKVPLSSMSPTLLLDGEGRVVLALGSPGSATIPSTVAQVIVNVVDHHMRLDDALSAPKIHHQWLPDRIEVEPWALQPDTAAALRARGHELFLRPRPFGNAQAVAVDERTGWRVGASVGRWEGAAAVP